MIVSVLLGLALGFGSCGSSKSYFTTDVRNRVEKMNVSLDKLQYYVDRDVELRRELESGDASVSSGQVKFENGKYVHIILLKKNTPGVCVKSSGTGWISVSFEDGEGKKINFGKPKDGSDYAAYQIYADKWNKSYGEITYDGKTYYIQPSGSNAVLMIRKSVVDRLEVEKRVMKGRKIE